MADSLGNISMSEYRRFLLYYGCLLTRTKGGHEHYTLPGLLRPITLQTHVDPVPSFIIRQHLRHLGKSKEDLLEFLGRI